MESNLTTPSRPTNNWAPKSGSPTAHLRGCVEPHFVICLGNAHRPSIRQEYTPHHLASRIHDPGLCNGDPTLSGPVSASGNHQRRSDTVRTGICIGQPSTEIRHCQDRYLHRTTLPAGSMIQDSATEIRHCQDRYLHRAKPSPITKPT